MSHTKVTRMCSTEDRMFFTTFTINFQKKIGIFHLEHNFSSAVWSPDLIIIENVLIRGKVNDETRIEDN
jgi:hypothetical protein